MILFYDIGSNNDIIDSDFSNSIKNKDIIANLKTITQHARKKNIRILHAIEDNLTMEKSSLVLEKIDATLPYNPLTIKSNLINEIELKSLLLEHDGDIFIEKTGKNIFNNPNLQSILKFYSANTVCLYGITETEEVLSTAISLNESNVTTVIIEDAIIPINKMELISSNLCSQAEFVGVKFLTTKELLRGKNGLHIL